MPTTTTVTLSRSAAAGGPTPYTVYGSRAAGTPSLLGRDGLVMPDRTARIRYAPTSDATHGQVALAATFDQSQLILRVRLEGATETALRSQVEALEAAVGQFSYTATVTRDGSVTVWAADTGSLAIAGPRQVGDTVVEVYTVTIPVYPIPT